MDPRLPSLVALRDPSTAVQRAVVKASSEKPSQFPVCRCAAKTYPEGVSTSRKYPQPVASGVAEDRSPVAGRDYPRTFQEFETLFPNERACREQLFSGSLAGRLHDVANFAETIARARAQDEASRVARMTLLAIGHDREGVEALT